MPIDERESTFAVLATMVLPKRMNEMRLAMEKPQPLSEFCAEGVGVKTIVKNLPGAFFANGEHADFSGCYVLLEQAEPLYVGISRTVVARLRQHVTGTTHFSATLAYRMACPNPPHNMTQAAAMKDPVFKQAFEDAKKRLKGCSVAFIKIEDDLELYLFEAYCAMALGPLEWNTFRTH